MSILKKTERHLVSFYEIDRAYGGAEEGGWYYDCGELVRTFASYATSEEAYKAVHRANRLLEHLQRGKRGVGSVLYSGGQYRAIRHEDKAPAYFPEQRPYYE